eukprot:CAMPEP_0185744224 /NCGR_PEP_ID=MMETSP1174-20130828/2262_1 /TAXON_ID=35687 /ORGANISM="Dictyocha speculum, Strain CCMP1381" /LENGTH=99 /DNA_ID=CAMNT_0028417477 /DNA_START=18 /DNA_END=317 /DNA_ORIENTATION=+
MMMFVIGMLAYHCLKTLKTEVSFFEKMFPDTAKACTMLMAPTKRLLDKAFSSLGFERENRTNSPDEYRAAEKTDIYHQGIGFEMAPNESDNEVERRLQT